MIHKLDPTRCGWVRTDGPHMWLLVVSDKYGRLYWSWQLRLHGVNESGVGGVAHSWEELERDTEASLPAAWRLVRERVILWEATNELPRVVKKDLCRRDTLVLCRCEMECCRQHVGDLQLSQRSARI